MDEELIRFESQRYLGICLSSLLVGVKKHLYPLLTKHHLCIPSTSVPSERVCSTASDVVTAQGAYVVPIYVDMLVSMSVLKIFHNLTFYFNNYINYYYWYSWIVIHIQDPIYVIRIIFTSWCIHCSSNKNVLLTLNHLLKEKISLPLCTESLNSPVLMCSHLAGNVHICSVSLVEC